MTVATTPFLDGVRLFNEERYWHAHEQWETCWLASGEPDSTFYKGIIQASAALVHWQRGNLRGLRRNWAKARPKLVAVATLVNRLDVPALIAEMDRFVVAEGRATLPRVRISADDIRPR